MAATPPEGEVDALSAILAALTSLADDRAEQPSAVPADARLLTPEDVARVLSISKTRVYELLGEGALQSRRIGRARRISIQALRDFVADLPTT